MTEMTHKSKANTLHVVSQWQQQSSLMADGGNLVNLITKNDERENIVGFLCQLDTTERESR